MTDGVETLRAEVEKRAELWKQQALDLNEATVPMLATARVKRKPSTETVSLVDDDEDFESEEDFDHPIRDESEWTEATVVVEHQLDTEEADQ